MRLPAPSFQLHAVGKGGAILENDGELLLAPELAITLPGLGLPVDSNTNPGGTCARSAFFSAFTSRTGAAAANDSTMVTLAAGIWRVDWYINQAFTGTNAVTERNTIDIGDASSTFVVIAGFNLVTGMGYVSEQGHFIVDLARDGFTIRHHSAATVAGDVMTTRASLFCSKVS